MNKELGYRPLLAVLALSTLDCFTISSASAQSCTYCPSPVGGHANVASNTTQTNIFDADHLQDYENLANLMGGKIYLDDWVTYWQPIAKQARITRSKVAWGEQHEEFRKALKALVQKVEAARVQVEMALNIPEAQNIAQNMLQLNEFAKARFGFDIK
jgi:hypothetical protein